MPNPDDAVYYRLTRIDMDGPDGDEPVLDPP